MAIALAACGSSAMTPSPGPSGAPPAASVAPPPSSFLASNAASPTAPPAGSGTLIADPGLLDALPPTVAGLAQQRDADRDAELVGDPSVVALGSGLASALYLDPAVGDFAYATVVRLRSGTLDEAAYRSWRDSFDDGACSQAGGVVGHAEADIGGHRTFIGSCAGGVRTYHTLTEDGLLVSVSSVSDRRLGEQLVEGLRRLP